MKRHTITLTSLLAFSLSLSACSPERKLRSNLETFAALASSDTKGSTLGRLGDIEVSEGNFLLAGLLDTIDAKELRELNPSSRELAIRQLVIRRFVVRRGFEEGIFGDIDAARYLFPRIERLLEDYYFYRKANGPRLEAESERLVLEDSEVKTFLAQHRGLRGQAVADATLKRESKALMRRVVAERLRVAREQLVRELLKNEDVEILK
ncbi:MAG: hypothetical protein JNM27_01145 [Leptospirales bacterium]|nr:hypothetical protein [Leptospirales bacterium]